MSNHAFTPWLASARRRERGFTLIEILIVGALIALFSGLAVISIQQVFTSNVRKAAIGETRQIATALEFANMDTSVFPRLAWLSESSERMSLIGTQLGIGDQIFTRLDTNGRIVGAAGANRLANQWDGPYFAFSQQRAGVAQGRGGFVYMIFPDLPSQGPNSVGDSGGIRWPADPWNNPYVVYMLDVDPTTTPPRLTFVTDTPVTGGTAPDRKGNFVNAVVSYGPNQYPGGSEFNRLDFGGDASVDSTGTGPFQLRLYRGRPEFRPPAKGVITHRYLTLPELTAARANVWSSEHFTYVPAGLQPTDETGSPIGITDPGSDDIVFEF